MMKNLVTAFAVSALIATGALAQEKSHEHKENETHEHAAGETGPHGGVIQDVAGYEAELVTKDGIIMLFLHDHLTDKPMDTKGMQASILFTQGSVRKGTLVLKPAGDRLQVQGTIPQGADAVISLRTKDGKTTQARFEIGGHEH